MHFYTELYTLLKTPFVGLQNSQHFEIFLNYCYILCTKIQPVGYVWNHWYLH